jgi:hypothetical protein
MVADTKTAGPESDKCCATFAKKGKLVNLQDDYDYDANYDTVLGYDDTEVCRRGALQ